MCMMYNFMLNLMVIYIVPVYCFSFFLGMNTTSFFSFWVALELNLLSFIYILVYYSMKKEKMIALKYFFIQVFFSSLLLMIFLMFSVNFMISFLNHLWVLILLGKLGSSPFHTWFIDLMNKSSWESLFLLSTFQKILPLFAMKNMNSFLIYFSVIFNLNLSVVNSWKMNQIKMLLAFSSIFNLAWMMLSLNFFYLMFIYLMLYMLAFNLVVVQMKKLNILNLSEFYIFNMSKKMKLIYFFSFMNLNGIPPLAMFLGKLLILQVLINFYNIFLSFFVLLISLFFIYIYLRLSFLMLLKTKNYFYILSEKPDMSLYFFFIMFMSIGLIFI